MSEIKTPLHRLNEGGTFTADPDGAYVITANHTHSDILRFVIDDLGAIDTFFLVKEICEESNA